METEYCPECIEELVKDKKKLGQFTNWMICPKCGFRKRQDSSFYINQQLDNFKDRIKNINLNRNQFNKDFI